MILLIFIQNQNHSFITHLMHLLHDGGLFFMTPILIAFFLVLFLIVKNILIWLKEKHFSSKYITLLNSLGLLILVWGVMGQLVGLIEAFDKIEIINEVAVSMLAGGLKISALPTLFGCFVFVVSRIATTIFTWIEKEELNN